MFDFIVALLTGLIGGFAGGLLGIGGGAIYVPAMVLILDEPQHMAQGASLVAIIATGLVGGTTHYRRGNVDLSAVALVTPIAIAAGFGGALLANVLDEAVLRRIFAVVVVYFALNMIVRSLRGPERSAQDGGS